LLKCSLELIKIKRKFEKKVRMMLYIIIINITQNLEEERIPKKILNGNFQTIRPVGRPRNR
jgi:hypothetical protein